MINRGVGFWALQSCGWVLLVYLIYAQGIPAFDYELGVSMGTQEPAATISDVGVAFWRGFAVGDVIVYIPLLAFGLLGHWFRRRWGQLLLGGALSITVYWPVVCLAAVVAARGAEGWTLPNERDYWLVLPAISVWGLWGLWHLSREDRRSG